MIDASKIKFIVLDVDGTLTDSGIYVLDSGEQFRKFNVKDGMGVALGIKRGLRFGIISHGKSQGAIVKRAEMMGVQKVYVGQTPKLDVLKSWCDELGIGLSEVAYVGDDVNDIEIMEAVGFAACPADAARGVARACQVVLTKKGGDGCVRELLDDYFLRD